MTKTIEPIANYMTDQSAYGGRRTNARYAHELMREYHIRHLPVLRGGQLVGMLSDRDLALVESSRDVDPGVLTIEEAMSSEVYTVSPEARLDTVVKEMATKKLGSAVVVQRGKSGRNLHDGGSPVTPSPSCSTPTKRWLRQRHEAHGRVFG
jgi:acetoin utilization protein AcuB